MRTELISYNRNNQICTIRAHYVVIDILCLVNSNFCANKIIFKIL